jgi:cell shape-determining protein MreC
VFGVLIFGYFGSQISNIFSPLWKSNTLVHRSVANVVTSLRGKDELIAENIALKEKLESYEELVISLRAIASSRDELIASFGREQVEGIPAAVLVRPPETPYDILIVDAGENLGVKPTSLVTTPEGLSIGTVAEVFSKTSRVKLYSTAGERTDAVLERGSESVTLVGRGGGNMEFTVPRDTPIEIGDRILLPHLATSLVAVVGHIEVKPTASFKNVIAKSPANPAYERYVIIER